MAEKKYHTFPKNSPIKLKDLLPLIRYSGYSSNDESGTSIILCPECEKWTWVKFNANSGLLDVLGELLIDSIDAEDGDIKLWVITDDFNYFEPKGDQNGERMQGVQIH